MDFAWSSEQMELQRQACELAKAHLNDGVSERDLRSEFNHDGWRRCAELGILGLSMPEEFGGSNADALTTVGVLESLGYGCRDNGLIFSLNAQMWTMQLPLLHFGSDAQKWRWLPGLISGEVIGGNAISEPNAGSDAYSLRTTAIRDGDAYVLNGSKLFVSNAGIADVMVVYATVDPKAGPSGITAFLVERDVAGLTVRHGVEKMGMRTSPMGELFLEGCRVPSSMRLGREGDGVRLFTHSMSWERACILAGAVGSMQRLLESSVHHAQTRKQFGKAIESFQMVAEKLVEMKMLVETARAMLYRTAWLRDQGKSVFMEAAMTKLHVSEAWVACAEHAMQVHGGSAYMKGHDVERELRDALGSRFYSGTSEIQRVIIASLLRV